MLSISVYHAQIFDGDVEERLCETVEVPSLDDGGAGGVDAHNLISVAQSKSCGCAMSDRTRRSAFSCYEKGLSSATAALICFLGSAIAPTTLLALARPSLSGATGRILVLTGTLSIPQLSGRSSHLIQRRMSDFKSCPASLSRAFTCLLNL